MPTNEMVNSHSLSKGAMGDDLLSFTTRNRHFRTEKVIPAEVSPYPKSLNLLSSQTLPGSWN
ncbi:hypothetical protein [Rhodohalobacter sp. SW132]|uniref:hypothetical protein n=1 Tax=Rhodohalobacter sp. SW132 TaxID=2293433 RepID=UPI0013151990|nr:hypothetical protein [Rhodohalobacter sp. SW132]